MSEETITGQPQDTMHDSECYFIPGLKADGPPFIYRMHKIEGIKGGPGPMGSVKSQTVTISIPRSKKANINHIIARIIKVAFFLIAMVILKPGILKGMDLITRLSVSAGIILAGGVVTLIFYQVNKTRSKFFFAGNHQLVKFYKKNGYKSGFHPAISTTLLGPVSWLIRLIF
jgi:hypothetical protein